MTALHGGLSSPTPCFTAPGGSRRSVACRCRRRGPGRVMLEVGMVFAYAMIALTLKVPPPPDLVLAPPIASMDSLPANPPAP